MNRGPLAAASRRFDVPCTTGDEPRRQRVLATRTHSVLLQKCCAHDGHRLTRTAALGYRSKTMSYPKRNFMCYVRRGHHGGNFPRIEGRQASARIRRGRARQKGAHLRQESHPLPGWSHPEDERAMSKIRNPMAPTSWTSGPKSRICFGHFQGEKLRFRTSDLGAINRGVINRACSFLATCVSLRCFLW